MKQNRLHIKVTRIENRWHARLFYDKQVVDEMSCECQLDIGWICRELLRWWSKAYWFIYAPNDMEALKYAEAARERQNKSPKPQGKIKYY